MDKKTLFLLLNRISEVGGDTYTKEEIDDMVSQLKQFEMEVVQTLPTTDIKPNCIYFVPRGASGLDSYYEYIYVNGKWEFVGSTDVDLSNYWTIDQTKAYIEQNKYVLPQATTETLGGIKLNSSGSLEFNDEGELEISTITSEQIAALFA